MGVELVQTPAAPLDSYDQAQAKAGEFIAASQANATRVAYGHDWFDFERWCLEHRRQSLPAEPATIATYLASLASTGKRKLSTIKRRCAAIGWYHRRHGHENPVAHAGVKATLDGIARTIGSAPTKKAALTADLLGKAVRKIPIETDGCTRLVGLRDRALLLIGFAAALRRSELVALQVGDVARHPKGLILTIRKSKTDQAGEGITKAVPHGRKLGAVGALDAWLTSAKIVDGPIFRGVRGTSVSDAALCSGQVARIVQKRCMAIGLDPKAFAGHSLRSGFITSAADAGASLASIAKHAAHEKLDTTLGYVQVADAFRDHSGKRFL